MAAACGAWAACCRGRAIEAMLKLLLTPTQDAARSVDEIRGAQRPGQPTMDVDVSEVDGACACDRRRAERRLDGRGPEVLRERTLRDRDETQALEAQGATDY
jgi:hypothetical protein